MIKFYNMSELETQLLLAALTIGGVVAILGSIYTFTFYFSKNSTVALLYKYMAVFDVLSGLNAILFVALCLTYYSDCDTRFYTAKDKFSEDKTSSDWEAIDNAAAGCQRDSSLSTFLFLTTAVLTRIPMFIGVLLSVVRSINITDPFYKPRKPVLITSIVVWAVIWGVLAITSSQIAMEFIYDDIYRLKDSFYRLLMNNVTPMNVDNIQYWEYMFLMMLSYMIPTVVMIASTVAQIAILYKTRLGGVTKDHIQITITIIIITCFTILCALPSSLYVAHSWARIGEISSGYVLDGSQAFLYGFGLPVLNSAVNPIIMISRSSALRKHWTDKIKQADGRKNSASMSTATQRVERVASL